MTVMEPGELPIVQLTVNPAAHTLNARRYWFATGSPAPPLIPATAVALTPAAVQSAAPPPPPPLPPLSLPSATTQEATPSVQQANYGSIPSSSSLHPVRKPFPVRVL